jgi:hypothetical protein
MMVLLIGDSWLIDFSVNHDNRSQPRALYLQQIRADIRRGPGAMDGAAQKRLRTNQPLLKEQESAELTVDVARDD